MMRFSVFQSIHRGLRTLRSADARKSSRIHVKLSRGELTIAEDENASAMPLTLAPMTDVCVAIIGTIAEIASSDTHRCAGNVGVGLVEPELRTLEAVFT